MNRNYNQFTLFDYLAERSYQNDKKIKEIEIAFSRDIPNDWIAKLRTYNLNKYTDDIEQFGIKTTWDYICDYVLSNDNVVEFLNVSNFGELYEIALAIQDKQQKKENGKYYTPEDVALVMAGWLKDLDAYNICDVACGTGKLILTYLDLIGIDETIKLLNEGRIYLYDLDEIALTICKTAILIRYGKQYSKNIHAIHCDFLNKDIHLPSNCKVISNPPYAGISAIPFNWDRTKIQLETKELYTSFMEKIILESDKSVIITPYSFIGGNKFYSLRLLMNDYSGFVVSFDNVPGNIFCGRKHGIFNTNTSNSVRAAITVVNNTNHNKGFRLSPLIRFKNEEREKLLNCGLLESTISSNYQVVDKKNKSFAKCQKELEEVYDAWISKSEKSLKDYISLKSQYYKIFVPNTCRYFTTASSYELKRTGMMRLNFDDEDVFNFIYCLINSSFAYWWWRIFDGGITYPIGLLYKLPIFINLLNDEDKTFFKKMTQSMVKLEKECIVTKLNAGILQENIKFPPNYRNQINERLLKILGIDNSNLINFDVVHKNSFFGKLNNRD